MPVTINGSGLASGVTSVPNLATFPAGPRLAQANMPAGSVLQVVNATTSTQVAQTTTTFIDTGLTASITPTSTSSKILVLVNQVGIYNTTQSGGIGLNLVRNGSVLFQWAQNLAYINGATTGAMTSGCLNYLDSPATTSTVTYKTQMNNAQATGSARVQNSTGTDLSTITLMEIAQ